MDTSKEFIYRYMVIHKEVFGEEISEAEAQDGLDRLTNALRILYGPYEQKGSSVQSPPSILEPQ